MGKHACGEDGQTLLEMLVAMAIMAMIGALSFPALENSIGALRFRRTADLVESDLRKAQAAAVSGQSLIVVAISRDGRRLGQLGGPQRLAPEGIVFASTPGSIGFFPDGSSTGGSLGVVEARRRAVFQVDPVTGGISTGAQ